MNQINVVPYVDVMLVLLVIFMVTAPLLTPGLVELPSVAKSSLPPEAPLEVIIRTDQSMLLRERVKGQAADRRRDHGPARRGGEGEAGPLAGPGGRHLRRQGRALRGGAQGDGRAAAERREARRADGKARGN